MNENERRIRRLPEVGTRLDRGLFQYSPDITELSADDRRLGDRILPLFKNKFNRPQPLAVDLSGIDKNPLAGSIIINHDNLFRRAQITDPDQDPDQSFDITTSHTVVPLVSLNRESISPRLARLIADAWKTELLLPDFSAQGQLQFGRIPGLHEGYIMWSDEERLHHELLGEVLVRACGWDRDQLARERELTLTRRWELSFDDGRQMVVYAEAQEATTNKDYLALALNIRQQPSVNYAAIQKPPKPTSAEILIQIAKQEMYHHVWYRELTEIHHDLDPEGTEQDLYYVFRNFRMPSDALITSKSNPTRAEDYRLGIGMTPVAMSKILYQIYGWHSFADKRKLALIGGRNAEIIELPTKQLDEIQAMSSDELTFLLKHDHQLASKLNSAVTILTQPKEQLAVA